MKEEMREGRKERKEQNKERKKTSWGLAVPSSGQVV